MLRAVGRGFTNAEVAEELYISQATVKTHLGSVLSKLRLRDRATPGGLQPPSPPPSRPFLDSSPGQKITRRVVKRYESVMPAVAIHQIELPAIRALPSLVASVE